ncbi:MAG: hypothetical protein GY850_14835 [bacterium]|nr:hypothetical protein [bacterium]
MQLMGYNLYNLGSTDLVFGLDFLKGQTADSELKTINANMVSATTGDPITTTHAVINTGGLRLGFIGIVGSAYEQDIIATAPDIELLDETAVLQQKIDTLQADADLIIVIGSTGLGSAQVLASSVTGIDVIICSGGLDKTDQPLTVNDTLIVKAGYDGKYIGHLTLFFDQEKQITRTDNLIVPLDSSIPDSSAITSLLSEYGIMTDQ